MKKNYYKNAFLTLLLHLFFNASYSFYQNLESFNYSIESQSIIADIPYQGNNQNEIENIINTLFKIWHAFDIMQSIQIAIPEDDPICIAILKDILSNFNKCVEFKEEINKNPQELKIIKTTLNHLKTHRIGLNHSMFNLSLSAYKLIF